MGQKVSIIIPVYNASDSLERCVESIALGEFGNTEIILVEDCSKDNSWDICVALSEKFPSVRCFQNKKNSGVSYTRNQGLHFANGEYIMFVDSDDWVSGKYVKIMVEEADNHSELLTICGLHYIDKVVGYRRQYLWNDGREHIVLINQGQFFDLVEQFLLQQLWNKIFRKDIILEHSILFDESQSMGEDFQFVLDYMKAAQIKKCRVINKPLYYYIRANNTSLMSNFGLIENNNEFERLIKLKEICGLNSLTVDRQYQRAIQNTKYNYIYQICRNTMKSKNEKIGFIEKIMKDGKAKQYFKEQKKLIIKEKIAQFIKDCRVFQMRVTGKLKREKRDRIAKKAYGQLKAKNISIISQNCIGGVFYHDMHMRFLSPTINLFFKEPDFVKFVLNLEYYMELDIEMHWDEEYPIGILEDVTVYFMHYNTCHEAKEAWNKRKERINWDKIIVIATDMEGFNEDVWEKWCQIAYPKVLFTAMERNSSDVVVFPQYKEIGHVGDLIPDREFYKDGVLTRIVNTY